MKNIHVIPTDNKYSRLYFNINDKEYQICENEKTSTILKPNRHIYITSDEEIKDGDWFMSDYNSFPMHNIKELSEREGILGWKQEDLKNNLKIILTTDQDLDGVQAIDDEFLQWFVKNPSCDEVRCNKIIPYNFDGLNSVNQDKFLELFYKSESFDEIKYNDVFDWSANEGKDFLKLFPSYKIIIPKEEPKKNFYCGDEVDYDDKCLEQCDGCVDATGVDYGYLPKEKPKYPIGGYAPGNYMCNCSTCKTQFQGDKRAVQCEPCAVKMIQKQHLIDMMKQDEELGMYDETFDEYLQRVKDRRTEDNYKYSDEELVLYNEYIMDSWRCGISVYKCLEFMYFAEKEIQPQQIWNEEKKKGLKELIEEYKQELTYSEAARKEERINDSNFFKSQTKKQLRYSEEDIENIIAETWIRCVGNDGNNFKDAKDKIIEQFKNK